MHFVENLRFQYDDNFQLSIEKIDLADGLSVIYGESGCGKSTLLKCLIGLHQPRGMRFQIGSVDLAKLPVQQRRLGVMMQSNALFDHLSASENIRFAQRARQIDRIQAERALHQLSERLGLGEFLNQRTDLLSGGQRQRVALARALAGKPRVLLLDEPFSDLDERNRSESRALLCEVIAEQKVPAVMVSHDRADREVGDLCFQMQAGQIVKIDGGHNQS